MSRHLIFLLSTNLFSAPTSQSAVIVDVREVGNSVIFSASGTLDTSGLTIAAFAVSARDQVIPLTGTGSSTWTLGGSPGSNFLGEDYQGFTSTGSPIGSNTNTFIPTSGTGLRFGVEENTSIGEDTLFLQRGFTSGDFINSTSEFANQSLASMGLIEGTYIWSWGDGPTSDSITMNIVPEPSTLGLAGLAGLGLFLRRKR